MSHPASSAGVFVTLTDRCACVRVVFDPQADACSPAAFARFFQKMEFLNPSYLTLAVTANPDHLGRLRSILVAAANPIFAEVAPPGGLALPEPADDAGCYAVVTVDCAFGLALVDSVLVESCARLCVAEPMAALALTVTLAAKTASLEVIPGPGHDGLVAAIGTRRAWRTALANMPLDPWDSADDDDLAVL